MTPRTDGLEEELSKEKARVKKVEGAGEVLFDVAGARPKWFGEDRGGGLGFTCGDSRGECRVKCRLHYGEGCRKKGVKTMGLAG